MGALLRLSMSSNNAAAPETAESRLNQADQAFGGYLGLLAERQRVRVWLLTLTENFSVSGCKAR